MARSWSTVVAMEQVAQYLREDGQPWRLQVPCTDTQVLKNLLASVARMKELPGPWEAQHQPAVGDHEAWDGGDEDSTEEKTMLITLQNGQNCPHLHPDSSFSDILETVFVSIIMTDT